MKFRKILFGLGLMYLSSLSIHIDSFAEVRTIQSISLRVNNPSIEPGEYLSDNSISTEDGAGADVEVFVPASEGRYEITEARFVSSGSRKVSIGDEISIRVTLSTIDAPDIDYKFKSSYGSSSASISGASYVSSSRKGEDINITIKLKPIKGQYDVPYDLEWDTGNSKATARWENPDRSTGYVDIALYRGSSQIERIEKYKGTSYDLHPYIKREGTYTFKVRSVSSAGTKYGTSSDWVESDTLDIDDDDVYKGGAVNNRGPNGGTQNVGWFKEGGYWYYRYPTGELKRDGWEKVAGKWYLFDGSGRMLTGWQNRSNRVYYLNNDGDMKTGWHNEGGKWYYLNTNAGTSEEGAMVRNVWLKTSDNKYYYIGDNSIMLEGWHKISEKWYYFYPTEGHMAVNTTINTFRVGSDGAWIR